MPESMPMPMSIIAAYGSVPELARTAIPGRPMTIAVVERTSMTALSVLHRTSGSVVGRMVVVRRLVIALMWLLKLLFLLEQVRRCKKGTALVAACCG